MKKEIIEETPKKFLYHKDHGAKLFEIDENPEGWVDSPVKLNLEIEQEASESLDEELGKVKPSKKGKK